MILNCVLPLLIFGCGLVHSASADEHVFRGVDSIVKGKHYADAAHVDFGDEEFPSKFGDLIPLLSNLRTLVVGGPRYTDWHVERLEKISTLQVLVLDSTDVSDIALARLAKSRPDLKVLRSQRWAIKAVLQIHREIHIDTTVDESEPKLRTLLGEPYFVTASRVDFGRLPDDELGPRDMILGEQVAPLKSLGTLTYLDLRWVRMNDASMTYLRPLVNLESLRLPDNEASRHGFSCLQGMSRLKSFTGRIDDEHTPEIAVLQQLESLDIGSGSMLTDAGLTDLGRLTRLKSLRLSSPHIHGAGLEHLAGLAKLHTLTLGSGVRDLTHLPKLSGLRYLNLTDTDLNDQALSSLANCMKLESVALQNTPIGDKGVSNLGKLPNLYNLALGWTRVGDAGAAHLKHFPQLRHLNLSGTDISSTGLDSLREIRHLESLILYSVDLDERAIQSLEALGHLKSLAVSYRPQSARGNQKPPTLPISELKARLKKSLPNCQIQ